MLVLHKINDITKKYPEKVAIVHGSSLLSYKELDERSNQIAHYLIENGVVPGDIVALSLPRSFDLICGMLAILKSGAAYLPLDENYPIDRIHYMCQHAKITQGLLSDSILKSLDSLNVVGFEKINFSKYKTSRPEIDENKSNLAYVIFTSGSTGLPKGVCLGHKALDNLINWQNSVNGGTRTLQFTPISFDVHFQEIFSTLTSGGELVLIDENQRLNPVELIKLIEQKKVERLFLPFVAFNQLADTAIRVGSIPLSLKHITTAGEQLKITPSIREFFKENSLCQLHNHYGPSETHVVTALTLKTPSDSWDDLPTIGKEVPGCIAYILDGKLNRVSDGDEGELFLGGVCLADGYLYRDDLTEERFIKHATLGRIYKTGDTVVKLSSGEIKYLGRKDGQVKIRGYRIEIGEIEAVLGRNKKITSSAVKVIELNGEKYLCAYYVGSIKDSEVRNSLKAILPDYMVPTHYVKLESMLLTPSGKVNYKDLPLPSNKRPDLSNEFIPASTKLEKDITQIWSSFLGVEGIGVTDNFFDLGGTSLIAIKVVVEINQKLSKEISVVSFFENPTVSQICLSLESSAGSKLIQNKDVGVINAAVAIIGMEGVFPQSIDVESYWSNLLNNKNCISSFTREELSTPLPENLLNDPHYQMISGPLPGQKEFDYKFFGMTPREAELMDPQQRKFLELAVHALESAGYMGEHKEVIGIFAGMGNSKYSRLVDQHPEKVATAGDFNVMLGLEKDYIATRVAHKLNLTGPALSIHTGCSTSLVSIIEAVKSIRAGDCTMALAGGISISGMPNVGHLHQEGGILSKDGKCMPFDASSSGTVFTEGAGLVVLKRLDKAIADQDNILAVVRGVGINNDGSDKMSFTAPSVKGQAQAIYNAQVDAGISADSISYIEAHGTATPVGDPIELEALTRAFRQTTSKNSFCYVGSVKANVGHLTSAAGVASVIKSIKILQTKTIPGLTHYKKANPLLNLDSSPFIINKETVTLEPKETPLRVGISSFGVGGTNAHIILEEFNRDRVEAEEKSLLFKLSAKSASQLLILEKNLLDLLRKTPRSQWSHIAFTLDQGRKNFANRSFLVSDPKGEVHLRGSSLAKSNRKLLMMMPGQGSQYFEMGKILLEKSPLFRGHFEEVAGLYEKYSGNNLKTVLFGNDSELINNTYFTQPALFVIQYSLAKTLMDLGLKADTFIGHSVGEYVCATLAGIFNLEDGVKLICKRADLMNKVDPGVMLSVASSSEIVSNLIKNFELDVAAINGSRSVVVAGPVKIVNNFKNYLDEQGIASVVLKTSHAFHSRMMQPVLKEFNDFADSIVFNKPINEFIPTIDTSAHPWEKSYWTEHISKTVNFYPTLKNIISQRDDVYLEVGPGQVLSKLVQKIALESKLSREIVSSMTTNPEKEDQFLLSCIGKLWTLDQKIHSKYLYNKNEQFRTEAPVYPFEKTEVWLESKFLTRSSVTQTVVLENVKNEVSMSTQKKDVFAKKLIEIFEESSGIEIAEYGNDACFIEMGMDSLFLTQMALQLKKEFKIQINFRQLVENFNSINALVDNFVEEVKLEIPNVAMPQPVASVSVERPMPSASIIEQALNPLPQVQIQQREFRPLMSSNASDLEKIIQGQLEIMRSQMELLQGRPISFSQNTSPQMTTQVKESAPSQIKTSEVSVSKVEVKKNARGADIKTAKDSFGAQAKINIERNSKFSKEQQKNIDDFFDEYNKKNKLSKEFTQKHRKRHADPRVVTGFKPENKEIIYPIVVKKSLGQKLWDLDGNTYIDMLCGFGSNFFGNGNETIKKLVLKQIEEGIEIGPQHPLVGEVSDLICELTGNDRAAFCNTGSEAVLGAMRLARTVTGREKIVVFAGSYHGINDEVIIRGAKQKPFPAAPGINNNSVSNMIVLDYGTDEALEVIRSLADDLAAVLVEPVQSRRSDFHPVEFLKEVRKITEKSQTCLIFDEVITGFRVHPAGAQGYFGIRADLCTYGKIVGGGMPIGVISGRSEYMDALDGGHWEFGDESTPTVGVTYFAGTFVRHPLALAAAKGSLLIIKEGGEELLRKTNDMASAFAKDLNNFCKEHNIPLEMNNFGSLMKPKWKSDVNGGELLFALLRLNGVHTYDGFPWFVNLAHTEEDLKTVLSTFRKCFEKMQKMGLLENSVPINNSKAIFNVNFPPHPKAKLGKDEKGNPAWFIEDEKNLGSYYIFEGSND